MLAEIERVGQRAEDVTEDIFRYTILLEKQVVIGYQPYHLVVKAARPTEWTYVVKLSVLEEDSYLDQIRTHRLESRSPLAPLWNPFSKDDYTLGEGEVMFRYLILDLDSSMVVKVRSNLEVVPKLRGLGLGKILFESYEPIVRQLMTHLSVLNGKTVHLLVRESSQTEMGGGWSAEMARRAGYEYVGISTFPTYQKVLQPRGD